MSSPDGAFLVNNWTRLTVYLDYSLIQVYRSPILEGCSRRRAMNGVHYPRKILTILDPSDAISLQICFFAPLP